MHTLGAWTYVLVAALAFLETDAFVGLIVPGETAIVLGGVVDAQGDLNLGAMLVLAWLAAALGDLASFALGRRLGRRFLLAHGPPLGMTAPRLARVERLFARHGAKAILAGRFFGLVRAVAPFLAGASGLRLRAFLPWSLIGTAAWATTFTLVGFAFHRSFSAAADLVTHGALALAMLATAALAWRAHRRASTATVIHAPVTAWRSPGAAFLSETTVKTHVSSILRKLGLRDRVQAVVAPYQAGLAPPRSSR